MQPQAIRGSSPAQADEDVYLSFVNELVPDFFRTVAIASHCGGHLTHSLKLPPQCRREAECMAHPIGELFEGELHSFMHKN